MQEYMLHRAEYLEHSPLHFSSVLCYCFKAMTGEDRPRSFYWIPGRLEYAPVGLLARKTVARTSRDEYPRLHFLGTR